MPIFILCLALASLWMSHTERVAAADKSGYRVGGTAPTPRPTIPYEIVRWDALVPENWKPARDFAEQKFEGMGDADPRAVKALAQLRKAWDKAPVVSAMNGKRISIAGFVVPLDLKRGEITEFLLVPYYGACIHTPPPPANQIIHVFPHVPLKQTDAKVLLVVNGFLETVRANTTMGTAGYRMKSESIVPYYKR